MDKDYWYQKWQSQDIGFNQSQPNKLMQSYFSSLKLRPGCRVFVPLCGQSIDMLWLAAQGYQVVIGVELSQVACSAFFEENKIPVVVVETKNFSLHTSEKITIFCGDFFKLDRATLDEIDAVYDRAALIALPKDVRKSYAEHLVELITPATMFLITTVYNQSEMQGPPFSVDESEVTELYSAHFDINQLVSKQFEVPVHLQVKGLTQAKEQAYFLTGKG